MKIEVPRGSSLNQSGEMLVLDAPDDELPKMVGAVLSAMPASQVAKALVFAAERMSEDVTGKWGRVGYMLCLEPDGAAFGLAQAMLDQIRDGCR